MLTTALAWLLSLCMAQPVSPPADQRAAVSYLDMLNTEQQRLVSEHAKHFRRFPDGSLWSFKVESDRKRLDERSPVQDAYATDDAPIWHCPSTNARASNTSVIFDRLDDDDVRSQLPAGAKLFTSAYAIFVTDDGILAANGKDLLYLAHPRNEIVRESQSLPRFAAMPEDVVFFIVPYRSRKYVEAAGRRFTPYQEVQVHSWKRIDLPRSRIARDTQPVTAEELAKALHDGKLPGLIDWKTKLVNSERGRWEWTPKVTKLHFRKP